MSKTILVGSRLPHGLLLDHPTNKARFEVKGLNSTEIAVPYITTEIPEDFWNDWKLSVGDKFEPLASGSIFVAKSAADALAFSKEVESIKTGFEKVNPTDLDKSGLEKA